MKAATPLLLGVAVGVLGTVLFRRLRAVAEAQSPEALTRRLADQVDALERRFGPALETARS